MIKGIEKSLCVDCGECVKACLTNCLSFSEGTVKYSKFLCLNCGKCKVEKLDCPAGAIIHHER